MRAARRLLPPLAAAACALAAAAPAGAEVRRAGSVLPPGQSGFVSVAGLAEGTGSPHLTDQTDLFLRFDLKPALFAQPGTEERPRPGVRIVRDRYGVPAVTGDSAEDAWFGVGYAVAQDRLFQLELFKRATTGRLAEILGRAMIERDVAVRRDLYTKAELNAQLARLPAELRARFPAYRDGINAWIAETRRDPTKIPGEFVALGVPPTEWTVDDSLAVGIFLARTVPSGDGLELDNARGLRAVGPRLFDRLIPLRTRGQFPTVPASEGRFPSQPGRTRRQERAAYARSRRFLAGLPLPPSPVGAATARVPAGTPAPAARLLRAMDRGLERLRRPGGSNMWAFPNRRGGATLFNGPQLGFSIPELFVEFEVHGPGLDVRGGTAPGAPVIATGHNGRVAFGVTSGLSDDDDLYVERLDGAEGYRFRGRRRAMSCREELFLIRESPVEPVPDPTEPVPVGARTERFCRTVHGPVQARAGDYAFARRYAVFGREIETLEGLAAVNDARTVADVDRALDLVSWNENMMAVDGRGGIGFWHPGRLARKPLGWDERLPYPGTGEAEWRGFMPRRLLPQVIDPRQGYLVSWNNPPSAGWTAGDAPARERLAGAFHRAAFLDRLARSAARRGGGFERAAAVDRLAGTTAQQRPLAEALLRDARSAGRTARTRAAQSAGARADAVLGALLRWDGSYHRTDAAGTVDPGVATWDAFKAEAVRVALGEAAVRGAELDGGKSDNHQFDVTNFEAYALRTLDRRGVRRAAAAAFARLAARFGTADPRLWREPRRLYDPEAQGAGSFPEPFPFFDRGTIQLLTETAGAAQRGGAPRRAPSLTG